MRFLTFLLSIPTALLAEGGVLFEAPQIFKVDWDTRSLNSADIDGDGLIDLALINNEKAQIEIFYQLAPGETAGKTERSVKLNRWEPVLDDARFERDKVFTGGVAHDLIVGDLNADQKPDLVYTNDRNELVIHYQQEKGKWSKRKSTKFETLPANTGTLTIADLRGDGHNDLLLIVSGKIIIFPDAKTNEPPLTFATSFATFGSLRIADFNGDGKLDIGYPQGVGSTNHFVARIQNADGNFVSEEFYSIEGMSGNLEPFGAKEYLTVSSENGTLQRILIQPGNKPDNTAQLPATAYAIPENDSESSLFAVADFDGDGKADVAASNADDSEIWIFFQNATGGFRAPESYPAFSNITSLDAADIDGDGISELILLSESEKALGISHFKNGRLTFPTKLPVENEPYSVAAADINGDGKAELAIAIAGKSSRTRKLLLLSQNKENNWDTINITGEKEVESRLQDMRFADANQDGRLDLLVLSSSQETQIFPQAEDGKFGTPFQNEKIAPEALSIGDIDADGKAELLVTRDSFTRSIRYNSAGSVEVVDQINAPESGAELLTSLFLDTEGSGTENLILVDNPNASLYVMNRDDDHVYRHKRTIKIIGDNFTSASTTDLNGDGKKDLLLFSEGHFWHIPLSALSVNIVTAQLHETDIKDMNYNSYMAGDLNADGRPDVVAIDNSTDGLMEILLSKEDASLESILHFKLFEIDQHYRGRKGSSVQPHAGILADLNNDGKLDICLLLHDRLLIYPQG
jgi:hypothetical protein